MTQKNPQEKEFLHAYETYNNAIFRHCYFRVFDRELAKDLTQETFIKFWNYMVNGNEVQNCQAFLYKIATNIIIDYKRKKREHSLEAMEEAGYQPSDYKDEIEITNARLTVETLMEVLDTLDDIYREPFLLRFIEGLKPKEIAEVLGEDVNVISVRITRAKRQIKQKMKKHL